jgi:hypothetical protein
MFYLRGAVFDRLTVLLLISHILFRFLSSGMFKLPHVAPQQQVDSTSHTADSIFISEAGILRFARDYGLTPYVASTKQVRVYLSAIFQCAV